MKRMFSCFLLTGLVGLCIFAANHSFAEQSNSHIVIDSLRCEYLNNPLGIDEKAPRLSWIIKSEQPAQKQAAYQILVASNPQFLMEDIGDLWDSGIVNSDQSVNVVYAGEELTSRQACYWKVRVKNASGRFSDWSDAARWTMGLLSKNDWEADWISFRDKRTIQASQKTMELPPARYYRKPFYADKTIQRAMIYATALGIYELHLNGERIGDQMFTPGWSDYSRRVYYNTFDVTNQVQQGENALGAIVADGWYSGYLGYGLLVGYGPNRCGRYIYGKTPALMAQLEIEYTDGSKRLVKTDNSWRVSTGPILRADMLMGETYDARLEQKGWNAPGFDDGTWNPVVLAEENGGAKMTFYDQAGEREVELGFVEPPIIQAYPSVPIRPTEEIRPVKITEPEEGTYIFNLGQNFSGVVRLRVRGPRGTKVQIRHGEMLHQDGRLMTENLRKAQATDVYILRGGGYETWTPHFTYHGFQYVELTGLAEEPSLDAVTGVAIHSDTPMVSSFECSDSMVNQLFQNITWTQRANFFEVPTDCPQRDERFGWMGDAQIYVRTATYNADVAAFFTKWLDDLEEAQLPNGAYPDYAPYPMMHGRPNRGFATAWMDAGIICPYTIYQVYNDKRVIERHYDSMQEFMRFRRKNSPDFLGVDIGNGWGDWLSLGEKTPIEYIDTVYFAYSAKLMAEMADAIGRDDDAKEYNQLFENIRSAFQKKYLTPTGKLSIDNQTTYALALSVGLIPGKLIEPAAARLAELIQDNDNRMSTGFLGTRPLLPVLTQTGYNDLAVLLLQSRRYPSWGYEIANGATSIWERWNSYTKEDGFASVSMNSFSHYSFGAVCEWMFRWLAGIDCETPGYKEIVIAPHPPAPGSNPEQEAIHWVKAEYGAIHGLIKSHWKREENRFILEITIPANTRAKVYLPASSRDSILINEKDLNEAEGIQVLGEESGRFILAVNAGEYRFTSAME